MTFPRDDSDLLMFLASSSTAPSAPVLLTYEIEQSVLKLNRIRNRGTQINSCVRGQLVSSDFLYLFTASQIHQVEFAAELLLRLSVLLFDVYQEDAVTPGAVLVHVYKETSDGHVVKNVMVTTTVKSFLTE